MAALFGGMLEGGNLRAIDDGLRDSFLAGTATKKRPDARRPGEATRCRAAEVCVS
jgi:hypothetical protein